MAISLKASPDRMKILKYVCFSGLIAAIYLNDLLLHLHTLGHQQLQETFKDGTDILTYNSLRVFGSFGNIVFGMTVILACLTTCIDSSMLAPHLLRNTYLSFLIKYLHLFSIIGFLFTTLGLEMILKIVPLLTFNISRVYCTCTDIIC